MSGNNGFGNGFSTNLGNDGFGSGFQTSVLPLTTRGLVLQYDINSTLSYPGSGIAVTDLQGNSNATLVNGPTYSSDGYLTFDGANDYLLTSTSLASKVTTDVTTISMWAYPMDNGVLLSELGQAVINDSWHNSTIELVTGTAKFGMWTAGGYSPTVSSAVATPLNAWHNFTVVYDGSKMIAYVNGTDAGSQTFARVNPIEGGGGIHYGIAASDFTNMGDGSYANMRLGQFLVYSVALTASEILQNYTATKGRYGL